MHKSRPRTKKTCERRANGRRRESEAAAPGAGGQACVPGLSRWREGKTAGFTGPDAPGERGAAARRSSQNLWNGSSGSPPRGAAGGAPGAANRIRLWEEQLRLSAPGRPEAARPGRTKGASPCAHPEDAPGPRRGCGDGAASTRRWCGGPRGHGLGVRRVLNPLSNRRAACFPAGCLPARGRGGCPGGPPAARTAPTAPRAAPGAAAPPPPWLLCRRRQPGAPGADADLAPRSVRSALPAAGRIHEERRPRGGA